MSDYYLSRGDARFIFHREHIKNDAIESGTMRPVVVIDPDDREAVERLTDAYAAQGAGFADLMPEAWTMPAMRMRQALRVFANPTPPKPDEPTGLGAVVEDEAGRRWVRGDIEGRNPWTLSGAGLAPQWSEYADITAARVLSEGVTP